MYTFKCGHLLHNWSLSKMWENHKCKMWPLVWIYCFWAWKKNKKLSSDLWFYDWTTANTILQKAMVDRDKQFAYKGDWNFFFFLHSKCTACFISTSRFELLRKSKCTACVDKGRQQAQQDPTDQQERRGITSKPGFIQEGTFLYACHVWTLHRAVLVCDPRKLCHMFPPKFAKKEYFVQQPTKTSSVLSSWYVAFLYISE